jgi:hypothetical protein
MIDFSWSSQVPTKNEPKQSRLKSFEAKQVQNNKEKAYIGARKRPWAIFAI